MAEKATTEFEEIDIEKSTEKRAFLIQEVSVKACPVKHVTVFIDRAEVSRIIELDVIPGDVEVLVKDLAGVIEKDSVRYFLHLLNLFG